VKRKGFTLLELLVVMSIIILLLSILLPCLIVAKDRALELFAMQVEVDKEGKVLLEVRDHSNIASYEGIYMIEINPPRNSHVFIKKPHHPKMKLIKRDDEYYIKWRPKMGDIGIHLITVVVEGEQTSEQEITIYVYNKKLLDAKREEISDAD
jgi:prepilin-type N-terminal cleavage/methylation domain-containing protein